MSKPRPNIVLLMVDQLAATDLAAYGHPLVKSPHIDSIAKRGAVFENFYSNFPLCAPARLALGSLWRGASHRRCVLFKDVAAQSISHRIVARP